MKINRVLLKNGVPSTVKETVDFSAMTFDPSHIRKIENCEVEAKMVDYGEILHVSLTIEAKVIAVCSYSLEDVELNLKISDDITFSDDEEDVDNYYEKGPIIDLDPYILGIVLANVPVRVVKKGVKLPKSGSGYRVLSEDDYLHEQSEKKDSRWDVLDSVEISEKD